MQTALSLLAEVLAGLFTVERKLILTGALTSGAFIYTLVRFYGMLKLRAMGLAKDWNWREWLADIPDERLRVLLGQALENDTTLREGGSYAFHEVADLGSGFGRDVGDKPNGRMAG